MRTRGGSFWTPLRAHPHARRTGEIGEFFRPLRARHVCAYRSANPGFLDAFARVNVSENSFGQVCAHLARAAQFCAGSPEPWPFRRVSTVSQRFATPRTVSPGWTKPGETSFCPVLSSRAELWETVRNRGKWDFSQLDAVPRSLTRAEVCEVWDCKVCGKPRSANQLNPPHFPPMRWGLPWGLWVKVRSKVRSAKCAKSPRSTFAGHVPTGIPATLGGLRSL